MRSRGIEILVGLFIIAGFLAALGLALKVSGLNLGGSQSGYKVYGYFENIGGLTVRSKVTVSGVQIGQVTAIRFDTDALTARVEMEINPDVDYLSSDSSAQILTSGLLGQQYIGISLGGDDAVMGDGDIFDDTQSALVLEDLIGQFLFNEVSE